MGKLDELTRLVEKIFFIAMVLFFALAFLNVQLLWPMEELVEKASLELTEKDLEIIKETGVPALPVSFFDCTKQHGFSHNDELLECTLDYNYETGIGIIKEFRFAVPLKGIAEEYLELRKECYPPFKEIEFSAGQENSIACDLNDLIKVKWADNNSYYSLLIEKKHIERKPEYEKPLSEYYSKESAGNFFGETFFSRIITQVKGFWLTEFSFEEGNRLELNYRKIDFEKMQLEIRLVYVLFLEDNEELQKFVFGTVIAGESDWVCYELQTEGEEGAGCINLEQELLVFVKDEEKSPEFILDYAKKIDG